MWRLLFTCDGVEVDDAKRLNKTVRLMQLSQNVAVQMSCEKQKPGSDRASMDDAGHNALRVLETPTVARMLFCRVVRKAGYQALITALSAPSAPFWKRLWNCCACATMSNGSGAHANRLL